MTSPAPVPGEPTAANARRVGMELRTARERLGWDRPAVAVGLRIKQAYLTAVEEGRLADLPGNSYAVGFLRAYASALGLDPGQVSRSLRAETAAVNPKADEPKRKPEPSFPTPLPERGVPAGAVAPVGWVPVGVVLVGVVLAAVVLAIAAYVGWFHFSASDRRLARAVPARLAATTPSPQVAFAPAAATPATASRPAEAVPAAQLASARPAVAPEPPAPSPAAAPSAASPQTAPAESNPASGAPAADGSHGMMLRATAEAWVEVRETRGRVLLNRVLHPGETWPVPAGLPPLLLTTGNAGGLELVVDGVASPPLGSSGAVRRDLPLDPALAGQGGLVPAAATAPAGSTAPLPAR